MEREERERFARQLLLPQVGEAGQLRLCEAAVRVVGDAEASQVAARYLARAGVRVRDDGEPLQVASSERVAQVAGDPSLDHAAAALLGALAAVDFIRSTLSLPGRDVSDPSHLTLLADGTAARCDAEEP